MLLFFFCGQKDLPHPPYSPDLATIDFHLFWANEENGQKFTSDTNVQSVIRQWLGQQPVSFFASGIQKFVDRWDKCLNELGRYVEKWNTNVCNIYIGNISLLSLFIFFSFLCCLSFVSYDRKLLEKIIRRWLCSVKRSCHNNDVIIKKFLCMFKIKFPTKCIFWIFPILRTNGIAPTCNLFIECPSYI